MYIIWEIWEKRYLLYQEWDLHEWRAGGKQRAKSRCYLPRFLTWVLKGEWCRLNSMSRTGACWPWRFDRQCLNLGWEIWAGLENHIPLLSSYGKQVKLGNTCNWEKRLSKGKDKQARGGIVSNGNILEDKIKTKRLTGKRLKNLGRIGRKFERKRKRMISPVNETKIVLKIDLLSWQLRIQQILQEKWQ